MAHNPSYLERLATPVPVYVVGRVSIVRCTSHHEADSGIVTEWICLRSGIYPVVTEKEASDGNVECRDVQRLKSKNSASIWK